MADDLQPTLFDVVPEPVPPATDEFAVEVIRSARRTRTVGAELRGATLRVTVPSWMSATEEAAWVDKMAASFRRKRTADRIDLVERAATLARRHELPRPRDIRWA